MVKYMRWTVRILGLAYSVFAIYFWFFQYGPRLLPAAILLSVPFVVAVAIAWKWQGKSPELLGGGLVYPCGARPAGAFCS